MKKLLLCALLVIVLSHIPRGVKEKMGDHLKTFRYVRKPSTKKPKSPLLSTGSSSGSLNTVSPTGSSSGSDESSLFRKALYLSRLYFNETSSFVDPSNVFDVNMVFDNNQQIYLDLENGNTKWINPSAVYSGPGVVSQVFNFGVYPSLGRIFQLSYYAKASKKKINGAEKVTVHLVGAVVSESCAAGVYTQCTTSQKSISLAYFSNDITFTDDMEKISSITSYEVDHVLGPVRSAFAVALSNSDLVAYSKGIFCTELLTKNGLFSQEDYKFDALTEGSAKNIC